MSDERIEFEETVLKAMVELEGMTFEEAKLTYKARENLPASAFCGPNRTYPCHDPKRVRAAIQRLMQFKPTGWKKILRRVCGRARKMKIVSPICKKFGFQTFSESKIVKWWMSKRREECAECEN